MSPSYNSLPPVLAIGASTGGPTAVARVLSDLAADFPGAVIVAQHLDDSFSDNLTGWLATQTSLPVALARDDDRLEPGRVYVARADAHLVVSRTNTLVYDRGSVKTPYRPSIDVLFESLANSRLRPGVAVLLTGMGDDGARGLLALRRAGWFTIAQDQATSVIYGMPKAARDMGAADLILPLHTIAALAAKHLPLYD
ncbi:MAG: CheB methylesterase domain-containing protein [Acidobacteriota bacterium]